MRYLPEVNQIRRFKRIHPLVNLVASGGSGLGDGAGFPSAAGASVLVPGAGLACAAGFFATAGFGGGYVVQKWRPHLGHSQNCCGGQASSGAGSVSSICAPHRWQRI